MKYLSAFILLIMLSPGISATENVAWQQGEVIPLELSVGTERKLKFPEPVRFGFKKKYQSLLSHSLIDNVFFVTPKVEFNERLTFQGLETNRIYLFDTHTVSEGIKGGSVVVHLKKPKSNKKSSVSSSSFLSENEKVTPVDLVQFASQSLYAPSESLIEPTPGVRRVPVRIGGVPNLYQGGHFSAEVLGGWYGGKYYLTAVKLINNTLSTIQFNPCRVRGSFYSVTAQFKSADPKGSSSDFTVIYLLSEKPFEAAISKGHLQCV